jgi:hypothetical protein
LVLVLAGCGKIPYPGAGQSTLSEAPKPQGGTALSASEIQIGAPLGFDSNVLQTIKSIVGAPIVAFEQSQIAKESALEQAQAEAPQSSAPTTASPNSTDTNSTDTSAAAPPDGTPIASPTPAPNAVSMPTNSQPIQGVECSFSETGGNEVGTRYVEQLRKKLPVGYIPFETEGSDEQPMIAIIKSSDEMEPLRLAGTASSGLFANRSTDDIINKVREWKAKYPLHVVTAKHDTAVLVLKDAPEDPLPLAKEARKFAPGDGSAHVSDFVDDIMQNKRIFLWFHS